MSDQIVIVRANPEDANALTAIAMAAKRHWGYPENWMMKWQEILTISPECVASNLVFKALHDERLVGFYVLINTKTRLELRHMWVHPDEIGKGVGSKLMYHAIRHAGNAQLPNMEIESDPNAAEFFQKMGARRVGARIYKLDGSQRVLPLLYLEVDKALEKLETV